jgi:hypothetical protein
LKTTRPIPDNASRNEDIGGMNKAGQAAPVALAPAWPRRALLGLWVLVFVLAGISLAARWDALISRLARPPVGVTAAEGALR